MNLPIAHHVAALGDTIYVNTAVFGPTPVRGATALREAATAWAESRFNHAPAELASVA